MDSFGDRKILLVMSVPCRNRIWRI